MADDKEELRKQVEWLEKQNAETRKLIQETRDDLNSSRIERQCSRGLLLLI